MAASVGRAMLGLQQAGDFDLLAWVFMPDHVHLVIQPRDQLVDCIRRLKSLAWRRSREETGFLPRLWQAGFHDRGIRTQHQLAAAIDYVHRNPVRAGLVEDAEDWPWPSFRELWPAVP